MAARRGYGDETWRLAAARDFVQPVFAYGPPRLVRFGMELVF